MSIGAIANIVDAAPAAPRHDTVADRVNQVKDSPPVAGPPETAAPQDATVTTLSDAARAQREAEESLRAAAAEALAVLEDQAARERAAVDETAYLAEQRRDAAVLAAINAEIRIAFGALPSPLTGDPVLREPGHVDVIA